MDFYYEDKLLRGEQRVREWISEAFTEKEDPDKSCSRMLEQMPEKEYNEENPQEYRRFCGEYSRETDRGSQEEFRKWIQKSFRSGRIVPCLLRRRKPG